MEIIRYVNGVNVDEKELVSAKTVTQEMKEAVNEARRRAQNAVISRVNEAKTDG